MKCVICKHGTTQPGVMTATFDREECVIVIKGVPAEICENCGEEFVDQDTARKLLDQVKEVAKGGVQIDVRKYKAA